MSSSIPPPLFCPHCGGRLAGLRNLRRPGVMKVTVRQHQETVVLARLLKPARNSRREVPSKDMQRCGHDIA